MNSFDSKLAQNNTNWWITSLAISVVCCSILFVVFASYMFQIKEDLAITKVRFDVTESRLNEMSTDIQLLNRRTTVQQIQIIPADGTAPSVPAAAVAPGGAAQTPPATAPTPVQSPLPPPIPAPAKH